MTSLNVLLVHFEICLQPFNCFNNIPRQPFGAGLGDTDRIITDIFLKISHLIVLVGNRKGFELTSQLGIFREISVALGPFLP